jgi:hypothetical protein
MTPDAFMKLALALPEVEASSHHDVPDYRVGERIFSTAGRLDGGAVLRLTCEQQQMLCEAEPEMFAPVDNAWGFKGWTNLVLAKADAKTARSALWMAWRNAAPKKLAKLHPPEARR